MIQDNCIRTKSWQVSQTSTDSKDYIIGSCKYRNEKIDVDELDLIRDYASVFGKGNNYHYYIFSKGGFTDGLLQAQQRGEIRQELTLAVREIVV